MSAFYNENDPFAAQWLRNLIAAGLIAPGTVDERDIRDVRPDELSGFTQCHFFAGIGGWSLALRLAGWPDDKPVWTGSCPCQPFSAAGAREGFADERHLWPHFHWLVAQCHPSIVLGEQVASHDGRAWLSRVCADVEALGFAFGAADLCAASEAAPHVRQRLYWLADADGGDASAARLQRGLEHGQRAQDCRDPQRMGITESEPIRRRGQPWEQAVAIECDDGFRRVGPSVLAVAHGIPRRMGRLRGYGNAIVPQVAAQFIGAFLDVRAETARAA